MKTKITLDIYKNGQNNKKSIYRRGLNFELSFSACVYGDWCVLYFLMNGSHNKNQNQRWNQ